MRLPERMATPDERDGLGVIHAHAGKNVTDVWCTVLGHRPADPGAEGK